jgi:tetratricopeptide (TPR) repeat protein
MALFSITRNYKVSEIGLPAATQALALFPSSPALMDLLGTGLMLENAYDEAEHYFLEANSIDPNQSAILIHLGQLYFAMGQSEEARDFLNQAVEFAKDNRLRELANRILAENGAGE